MLYSIYLKQASISFFGIVISVCKWYTGIITKLWVNCHVIFGRSSSSELYHLSVFRLQFPKFFFAYTYTDAYCFATFCRHSLGGITPDLCRDICIVSLLDCFSVGLFSQTVIYKCAVLISWNVTEYVEQVTVIAWRSADLFTVTQPKCVTSLQDEWNSLDRPPEGIIDQLVGRFAAGLQIIMVVGVNSINLDIFRSPRLAISHYCQHWLCLSVCLSVCHKKFFLHGIEPFFGNQFSMWHSTKHCS